MASQIPVRNIYYMLCYAWRELHPAGEKDMGTEAFGNIHSLLARLLVNGTNELIRRGLGRGYREHTQPLEAVRGRVLLSASVAGGHISRGRLVCEYDDFSVDTLPNKILKACLLALSTCEEVDSAAREELRCLARHFAKVGAVRLQPSLFMHLPRQREGYGLLMCICELLVCGLMAEEQGSGMRFTAFVQDERMALLYQNFILHFYKRHLDAGRYRVHRPYIYWRLRGGKSTKGTLAPRMETDIVVEDKLYNTQLILDAKYYAEALTTRYDVSRANAAHLYQLYAYITNSRWPGAVGGMLVYPTVAYELNEHLPFEAGDVYLKTLNLAADWPEIETRLLSFIQ